MSFFKVQKITKKFFWNKNSIKGGIFVHYASKLLDQKMYFILP